MPEDLLAALLSRAEAGGDPGAPALSPDGDTWLTAADLLARARRRAAGTAGTAAAAGAGPTTVAVAATDPVSTVEGLLAARLRGATPVVVPPDLPGADLELLLEAVSVAARTRAPGRAPRELMALATSGSTGRPRAVLRTTASWQASLEPFGALAGGTDRACGTSGVAWAPGPASSTLTLWAVWHGLCTGVPVVATGAWRRRLPGAAAGRVAVVHAVPAVVADLLADAPEHGGHAPAGLPACRRAVVAGAPLPGGLRGRARARDVHLVEYYGAAELSFVAADVDGDGLRAFPGAQVRVREGRIEVRSPYLSLGPVDPAAEGTAGEALFTPDGWAGAGDLGDLSPDGVLTVRGRGEDVLSVGGTVVHAADVEAVLGAVPGVLEVCCVGVPHPRLGQVPVAAVRLASGGGPGAPAPPARADVVRRLRTAARDALPRPAHPVRYLLLDELPRTPGGKVDRRAVRASVGTD